MVRRCTQGSDWETPRFGTGGLARWWSQSIAVKNDSGGRVRVPLQLRDMQTAGSRWEARRLVAVRNIWVLRLRDPHTA